MAASPASMASRAALGAALLSVFAPAAAAAASVMLAVVAVSSSLSCSWQQEIGTGPKYMVLYIIRLDLDKDEVLDGRRTGICTPRVQYRHTSTCGMVGPWYVLGYGIYSRWLKLSQRFGNPLAKEGTEFARMHSVRAPVPIPSTEGTIIFRSPLLVGIPYARECMQEGDWFTSPTPPVEFTPSTSPSKALNDLESRVTWRHEIIGGAFVKIFQEQSPV